MRWTSVKLSTYELYTVDSTCIQEVEAKGLQVPGQQGLHSEPCLKKDEKEWEKEKFYSVIVSEMNK